MLFSKGKIKNISKFMNPDMFKPLINIESGIIIVLIVGFSLLFAYTLFVKTSIIEGATPTNKDTDTKDGDTKDGDKDGDTKDGDKDGDTKDGDKDGDTKDGDKDTKGAKDTNKAVIGYASGKTSDAKKTLSDNSVKQLSSRINTQ